MRNRVGMVVGLILGLIVFSTFDPAYSGCSNLMRSFGDIELGDSLSTVEAKLKRHSGANSLETITETSVTVFKEIPDSDTICWDVPLPELVCQGMGMKSLYGITASLGSMYKIGDARFASLRFTFEHDRLVHMALSSLQDSAANAAGEEILKKYNQCAKKEGVSEPGMFGIAGDAVYFADAKTGVILMETTPPIGPGSLLFVVYDLGWMQRLGDLARKLSKEKGRNGASLIR